MVDENAPEARMRPAWEARAAVDPEAVKGRSEAIYGVLSLMADGHPRDSAQIAEEMGMKRSNTNRILHSLRKYGQIDRVEGEDYEVVDRQDGHVRPSRRPYAYQITDRGRDRRDWLHQNKPWDPDS